MTDDHRCSCGMPSLPGLKVPYCQRHYNIYQWGKEWAEEVAKKKTVTVRDRQTGGMVTYVGLYEEEAVRNAYLQFEKKDFNTWDYNLHNRKVERSNGRVFCDRIYREATAMRGFKRGAPRFVVEEVTNGV